MSESFLRWMMLPLGRLKCLSDSRLFTVSRYNSLRSSMLFFRQNATKFLFVVSVIHDFQFFNCTFGTNSRATVCALRLVNTLPVTVLTERWECILLADPK